MGAACSSAQGDSEAFAAACGTGKAGTQGVVAPVQKEGGGGPKQISVPGGSEDQAGAKANDTANGTANGIAPPHLSRKAPAEQAPEPGNEIEEIKEPSPLMAACAANDVDAAELLAKGAAGIDETDQDGKTPLIMCCEKGNLPIAQTLLANGASVHISDKVGNTPLIVASANGHLEIVKELIARGAKQDLNEAGETALHLASVKGHTAVVEVLQGDKEEAAPTAAKEEGQQEEVMRLSDA